MRQREEIGGVVSQDFLDYVADPKWRYVTGMSQNFAPKKNDLISCTENCKKVRNQKYWMKTSSKGKKYIASAIIP